jgi:cyanophycin synthetase
VIKILEKKVLRGANVYSYRPVIVLAIDLGEYDEVPTSEIEGFVDRLLELIPSLEDHRCSEGVKGGLITRMQEGTLLGHVIEHIALELQYIAYMDVGFGKTIDTDKPGVFEIIFSYWVEKAGLTRPRLCSGIPWSTALCSRRPGAASCGRDWATRWPTWGW